MECEHYENDEVMAELGRTMIDIFMNVKWGQHTRARTDAIALALYGEVSRHVTDDEDEDDTPAKVASEAPTRRERRSHK